MSSVFWNIIDSKIYDVERVLWKYIVVEKDTDDGDLPL